MKRREATITGAAVATVVLILSLSALTSCHSLFDAAVGSMVDRETDAAGADAPAETAAAAQPATGNIDPSVHRIVGAWENSDYNRQGRSARVVFSLNADGSLTYLAFDRLDGSGEVYEGTATYVRTWIDEAGRSCGESTVTLNNGMSWNTLDRISVDGDTLEVQSGVRKIDPKGPRYSIYYRP